MKIALFLKTLVSYVLIGLSCLVFMLPAMLIACLPARYRYDNRIFFFLAYCFYKCIVYAPLNKVTIKGKENLPKEPAIFVANHQSSFDIPLLGSLCGMFPHVWLVLEYYIKTPVLGFFIRRMFISVDSSNPAKAARSLIQVYRFLNGKKRHLLIYPEGGRFNDGTIHHFFVGFAVIARKTGRPVIPVFMPNNGKIFPPYSFLIYSYPVVSIVGEPMYIKEDETDVAFVARVRQWFVEMNAQYVAPVVSHSVQGAYSQTSSAAGSKNGDLHLSADITDIMRELEDGPGHSISSTDKLRGE